MQPILVIFCVTGITCKLALAIVIDLPFIRLSTMEQPKQNDADSKQSKLFCRKIRDVIAQRKAAP